MPSCARPRWLARPLPTHLVTWWVTEDGTRQKTANYIYAGHAAVLSKAVRSGNAPGTTKPPWSSSGSAWPPSKAPARPGGPPGQWPDQSESASSENRTRVVSPLEAGSSVPADFNLVCGRAAPRYSTGYWFSASSR